MKRVSKSFMPLISATTREQVLQTPPYTFIHYATPSYSRIFLSLPVNGLTYFQLSLKKLFNDITFFLTILYQYILNVASHTVYSFHSTMWTITTTIGNNKKQFVTLITPLNKFCVRTASSLSLNSWYRSTHNINPKKIRKDSETKATLKKP